MTSHRRRRGYVRPFDETRHAAPAGSAPVVDPMADALAAACKSLETWGAVRVQYGVDSADRNSMEHRWGERMMWFEATTGDGHVVRAESGWRLAMDPMVVLNTVAIILRGQGTEVAA